MTEAVPETPTPIAEQGRRSKNASRALATATTGAKNSALLAAADLLVERADEVAEANAADVAAAKAEGTSATLIDRLRLTDARIEAMAGSLRQVAALPDPVGEVIEGWTTIQGLRIRKVRVPLGVVAIIYEARPNVTSDAAALCLKSGNAAFLRGSSSTLQSNLAISAVLREGFAKAGLPADSLILVDDIRHEAAVEFMQARGVIDCLIPRGGPGLIAAILDHATVPYVIDGDGNCQIYVDSSANLDQAIDIVINAKTQRPSVCNAAESLIVHEAVAAEFLPPVTAALREAGVEMVGDGAARSIVDDLGVATDEDFSREFLSLKISIGVVADLDAAIAHVNDHSSGHTEAILASDHGAITRFTNEVDAAAVMVNASTRFTDGEMFGFGAEIGISTQKLHARGPMGLRELTTTKYVVEGEGHVRG